MTSSDHFNDEGTAEFNGIGETSVGLCPGQEASAGLTGLFGFKSGQTIDRFASVRHRIGRAGAPILFEGAGHQKMETRRPRRVEGKSNHISTKITETKHFGAMISGFPSVHPDAGRSAVHRSD